MISTLLAAFYNISMEVHVEFLRNWYALKLLLNHVFKNVIQYFFINRTSPMAYQNFKRGMIMASKLMKYISMYYILTIDFSNFGT